MTKMEIKGFSDSDKLDELLGQEFFFEKKTNEINSLNLFAVNDVS